jgi:hypothetical protein
MTHLLLTTLPAYLGARQTGGRPVCIAATVALYRVSSALGTLALIVTLVNFWSLGVMHNYRNEPGVSGGYERFVISVNMITSVTGLVLLILGLIRGC